ncbi:MAG: Amidohydrolase [Acidimicrobiaceae bacterium]|nr:Amidohydrolase [Acidimicrobiaceae bacterium]
MRGDLVITGRIFRGSAEGQSQGWILVRSNLIARVESGVPPPFDDGTRFVDAGQRTVLPGLIDSHVHVVGLTRGGYEVPGDPYRLGADVLRLARGLKQVVATGITTIRDCGFPHHGVFALRDSLDTRLGEAPRLVLSGRSLSTSGGHGVDLGVEADGADGFRRAARVEIRAGADWIKLMATGGTATPGELPSDVQMTSEEITAAVEEAHRRGRRVCAHTSNATGAQMAVAAAVDSIEHGIELQEETVAEMAEKGIWLSPTLACSVVEAESSDDDGIPRYVREKAKAIFERQQDSFQRALAGGVRIVASTDAGPAYLPLGTQSLGQELATMVQLGMSPAQALDAATSSPALMLGLEDSVGRLQPDMVADVLVVDGDALADVRSVACPWLVLRDGVVAHGKERV